MAMDMTEKEILKMQIDQLKKEVKVERLMLNSAKMEKDEMTQRQKSQELSKTAAEIKEYIETNSADDPLLKPIPEDKNPFKDLKGGCTIS